ncbi:MAG: flagellar filament capping protein FliD [Clostridiales bacterium]|jgi:flagellar capping protein FliD|nr:flagellar filament capping protein FliD [Clostridiales bacterium]
MVIRKTNEDTAASSNAMLGLSGLDTASMLKAMMAPYKKPIILATQKQQLVLWRQERYRSFIDKINEFKATYFDFKSPAKNILAEGTFKNFTVDNPGSQYVKIKATVGAKQGDGTVEVATMPTAASLRGADGIAVPVRGTVSLSTTTAWTNLANRTFTINMDGLVRSVTFDKDIGTLSNPADWSASVQQSVNDAFGPGQILVSLDASDRLQFDAAPGVGQITVITSDSTTASYMGFTSNANHSNRLDMNSAVYAIKDRLNTVLSYDTRSVPQPSGPPVDHYYVNFTINGKKFEFDTNTRMNDLMAAVNADPDANVTMKYDNITGTFSITADVCGPGDTVNLSESNTNFLAAIGLLIPKDSAPPGDGLLHGGLINAGFVGMANAAMSSPGGPYEIEVKVDGVAKIVTLDNGGMGLYGVPTDIVADINTQLVALFPGKGFTLTSVSLAPYGSGWRFDIAVDGTATSPAREISVAPVAGTAAADADALFAAMGLNALPRHENGVFGKVIINGTRITVDRKDFEYEGIEYTLVKATPPGDPVAYSISVDADTLIEKIRSFIDSYNSLLGMLNEALGEARYGDTGGNAFQPLTDEQREGMSESEIEKWEEKSKLGLLRGDQLFVSLVTKIRRTMFAPISQTYTQEFKDGKWVDSFSDTLAANFESIGIFTSENYQENGLLHIDETKLRAAITANIDMVAKVFANTPAEIDPSGALSLEYKASAEYERRLRLVNDSMGGIAYKLNAILDDYVRTARNVSGSKGYLLERAGVPNDATDLDNAFTREIYQYNSRINSLWDRYDRIEKEKIQQLSRLETYVAQASQQMAWISSQAGTSAG